jgi:hypothetical protein
MWCSECRQEVPATASEFDGALTCVRCGHAYESFSSGGSPSLEEIPGDAWTELTGWQASNDLGQIGQMLAEDAHDWPRRPASRRSASGGSTARSTGRQDAAPQDTAANSGWHAGWLAEEQRAAALTVPQRPRRRMSRSIGPIILLSMMSLACGGSLLVWSVIGGRADLWDLGFPIAVAGQIALAVGVVLQLERIWIENRHLDGKLDAVDSHVKQLTQSTRADAAVEPDDVVPTPHFATQPSHASQSTRSQSTKP